MRDEVRQLIEMGPMPDSAEADVDRVARYERLIGSLSWPVTDEEARALVSVLGPDDGFGLAWSLVHAIETAPGWPLKDCLQDQENAWIRELRQRSGQS
jgi:hypothetical protein